MTILDENDDFSEGEPLAYSVKEACLRLGGIGRSTFYRMVDKGDIAVRKLGSRTVVMAAEIRRYLNSLPPKPCH